MDALKKAELAKRKTQADSAPPPAAASESSPLPGERAAPEPSVFRPQTHAERSPAVSDPGHPRSAPLPSLPDHLELLDDEFAMQPATGSSWRQAEPSLAPEIDADEGPLSLQENEPPVMAAQASAAPAAAEDHREAIKNLFETKQAPASRKTFAIGVGIASLLAASAIGGYFWYQLQPKSNLLANPANNASRPPPATSLPIAPPPAATEPAAIPGLAAKAAPNEDEDASPAQEIVKATPAKPPVAPEKKLFQTNKASAARSDPALERGYAALNHGDTAGAKNAYEQALGNDPRNADALSGLAVLAQNAGSPELAADYYLRILEADPHHAFALAGLIGLQSRLNPSEAESRLKQALSAQPDSAALNFGLGNLYASAKRWPDAQQAYFKAVAADPGNPDYLFNLAVSLDQLRQPKLAANYYAQAIAAAGNRAGSFDKGRASERLQQLQQQP